MNNFLVTTMIKMIGVAPVTLVLFVLSLTTGAVLAVLLLWARIRGPKPLAWTARAYVFVFRGTPLLMQMFLIYYGLAQFALVRASLLWPILQSPFYSAVLSIALCTAAYQSEIFRGGLLAVPDGEIEAARACGMSGFLLYRRIIAPLALKQALPAYSTEAVMIIKSTALASLISVWEITGEAQKIMLASYRTYAVFLDAAILYLFINFIIIKLFNHLERRVAPQLYAHMGRAT